MFDDFDGGDKPEGLKAELCGEVRPVEINGNMRETRREIGGVAVGSHYVTPQAVQARGHCAGAGAKISGAQARPGTASEDSFHHEVMQAGVRGGVQHQDSEGSSGAVARDVSIDTCVRLYHTTPAEEIEDALPRSHTQFRGERRISEKRCQPAGEIFGITGAEQ